MSTLRNWGILVWNSENLIYCNIISNVHSRISTKIDKRHRLDVWRCSYRMPHIGLIRSRCSLQGFSDNKSSYCTCTYLMQDCHVFLLHAAMAIWDLHQVSMWALCCWWKQEELGSCTNLQRQTDLGELINIYYSDPLWEICFTQELSQIFH